MHEDSDQGLFKELLYIDGDWRPSISGETFEVFNPATGERLAEVQSANKEDTKLAIEAANNAFTLWRNTTAKERSKLLRKWFELIIEYRDMLARIITEEQGKPLGEALAEVDYGASYIEWFAEEAKRIYGDIVPSNRGDTRLLSLKQPVGVVAAITPWNFPCAMLTRKAGPALACGCTMVIKPAKETPLTALALFELAHRAGIPKGVLNLVVGKESRDIGDELTSNPKVKKITFTGSTPVGKHLLKQSANTVKKVSMELGGNAPVIIFDDADIAAAVEDVVASKFRNAGQTCICINRILVQDGIYEQFVAQLTARVNDLIVGHGLCSNTSIGPMINVGAKNSMQELVDDAIAKGAEITTGGMSATIGPCFYLPTVLSHVTDDMRVMREEIFGPIAPVRRFSTVSEAIEIANDTEFGLASYIFTRDISRIWRVSEAIEAGMVGINEVGISNEAMPFGGVKESGLGREGSRYGIDDYIEMKYMCIGGV